MHHERLDQPDLLNGCEDCSVAANVLLGILYLSHRQNSGEWKSNLPHFEPDFYIGHAVSCCLVPSLLQRYFGIVDRDSALNRFTKFSSVRSLLNAVTIKTNFASQILAFRIRSFCR